MCVSNLHTTACNKSLFSRIFRWIFRWPKPSPNPSRNYKAKTTDSIYNIHMAHYIVPIPKPKEFLSKSLSYGDFRGIAISPIISKVFEYCFFLDRFGSLLSSSDNQFGFKKDSGCRNAIYTFRNIRSSTAMLLEVQLPTFVRSIYLRLLIK